MNESSKALYWQILRLGRGRIYNVAPSERAMARELVRQAKAAFVGSTDRLILVD